jgi:hypothetical protein
MQNPEREKRKEKREKRKEKREKNNERSMPIGHENWQTAAKRMKG